MPSTSKEPSLLICGNHIYRNGELERTLNGYGYMDDTTCYYYIKDYQGNVRAVIDQNGVLKEVNNYYPYGGLMGVATTGVQPNKYGAKELDRENGIDWYDSQARFYDPLIGRTTTMDPMAEKYYPTSPYAWCANNPILVCDTDGRRLRFANNVSDQFKNDFSLAVMYLKENECDGILAKLERRDEIIYIAECTGSNSRFDPSTRTIYWDPRGGLLTEQYVVLSPSTVLNHEADHALQELIAPIQKKDDLSEFDPDYDNLEEKRVITGSEQRTARALGEIDDDKVTRTNHLGWPCRTLGPTTTSRDFSIMDDSILDEIIIIGPNKNSSKQDETP